jgi:hypothetical protein
MYEKLEAYLEEISHFLSGREEREEILAEIRSHVQERAGQEFGAVTEETLDRVIAAYGPARRVAEKYLDGRPIIAPAYKRFLFRYTALLFAIHSLLTLVAVVGIKKSFIFFPILYIPALNPFEALFYLPTAFLFDFGVVALVLTLITQSQREVRLPWPRLSVDLDEVKPPVRTIGRVMGLAVMTALSGGAVYLYARFGTIFLIKRGAEFQPIFTPDSGRWYSLILIGLWVLGAIRLAVGFMTSSPWADAAKEGLSLVLLGLVFRYPLDTALAIELPPALVRTLKPSLTITVLVISIFVAADFFKALVRIGRRRLA